jgi:hypothetical protein
VAARATASWVNRAAFAFIVVLVSTLAGCAPTRWLLGLPPPAPRSTKPEPPSPPTTLALAADVGGGWTGDMGRDGPMGPPLASHPGLELAAGIGGRRGNQAVLFRMLVDYAPGGSSSSTVRAGGIGASYLYWETIPFINLPIEGEVGAGLGAFSRVGEPVTYLGLDIFGGIGVPLRAKRDLLLEFRFSNIHSQSNTLSLFMLPFGNQQVLAFGLAISWRPN